MTTDKGPTCCTERLAKTCACGRPIDQECRKCEPKGYKLPKGEKR